MMAEEVGAWKRVEAGENPSGDKGGHRMFVNLPWHCRPCVSFARTSVSHGKSVL